MISTLFLASMSLQPSISEYKPTLFPRAEVRHPDGSPNFQARSNFVEQVEERSVQTALFSYGRGTGGPNPLRYKLTGMARPRFEESLEVPPEAEHLFKFVKRPQTRYSYDRKILWFARGISTNAGQQFALYMRTKTTIHFESRVWRGVVYQRTLSVDDTSFRWELRKDSGELVQSGT